MTDRRRSVLIVLFSVVAAGVAIWGAARGRVLWTLTPIPALVGVMYHLLSIEGRYQNRAETAKRYRQFVAAADAGGGSRPPAELSEGEETTTYEPKLSATIWAASLLTVVLAIPAAVSEGGKTIASLKGGEEGLVYAGLGVYTLIVLRTIGRLNAGALHARFMMTAALKVAVALTFGYVVGLADPFGKAEIGRRLAMFMVGLFYPFFFEWLYDEAIKLFKRDKLVTRAMPLKMIEGIDDDVADVLAEYGISDVQHVASSDPGVLTLRTLYPFERVVDWIDQAMLIRRFGNGIVALRRVNLQRVTDLIPRMQQTDTEALLKYIADADEVKEPVEGVRLFALAMSSDYKVNLLWNVEQRTALPVDEEVRTSAVEAAKKFRAENPNVVMPTDEQIASLYDQAWNGVLSTRITVKSGERDRARNLFDETFRVALGV